MGAVQKDPYRVVMKQSKLPMSLLHDRVKAHVSIKGRKKDFCIMVLVSRGDVHCLSELTPFINFIMRILAHKVRIIQCRRESCLCFPQWLVFGILWGEMNTRPHFNPHSLCPTVTLSVLALWRVALCQAFTFPPHNQHDSEQHPVLLVLFQHIWSVSVFIFFYLPLWNWAILRVWSS